MNQLTNLPSLDILNLQAFLETLQQTDYREQLDAADAIQAIAELIYNSSGFASPKLTTLQVAGLCCALKQIAGNITQGAEWRERESTRNGVNLDKHIVREQQAREVQS